MRLSETRSLKIMEMIRNLSKLEYLENTMKRQVQVALENWIKQMQKIITFAPK